MMRHAYFTVDLEQDCPPYLDTWRGMQEGVWLLLELLRSERVTATFFATGDAARRHPDVISALLADGHELGCHGMTHRRFTDLARDEAAVEIRESSALLRTRGEVVSFRAPYLSFPDAYLELLEREQFRIDASIARYKPAHWRRRQATSLRRVSASITPSVLRLPRAIREPWLRALREPPVLFVHPWEFVDVRHTAAPLDCRFNTGGLALARLRDVLRWYTRRGFRFQRLDARLGIASPA